MTHLEFFHKIKSWYDNGFGWLSYSTPYAKGYKDAFAFVHKVILSDWIEAVDEKPDMYIVAYHDKLENISWPYTTVFTSFSACVEAILNDIRETYCDDPLPESKLKEIEESLKIEMFASVEHHCYTIEKVTQIK